MPRRWLIKRAVSIPLVKKPSAPASSMAWGPPFAGKSRTRESERTGVRRVCGAWPRHRPFRASRHPSRRHQAGARAPARSPRVHWRLRPRPETQAALAITHGRSCATRGDHRRSESSAHTVMRRARDESACNGHVAQRRLCADGAVRNVSRRDQAEPRPAPWGTLDVEPAAEQRQTFADAEQSPSDLVDFRPFVELPSGRSRAPRPSR